MCSAYIVSFAGNGTGTGSDQIGIKTVVGEIALEAETGRRGGTRRNRETRTETGTGEGPRQREGQELSQGQGV